MEIGTQFLAAAKKWYAKIYIDGELDKSVYDKNILNEPLTFKNEPVFFHFVILLCYKKKLMEEYGH